MDAEVKVEIERLHDEEKRQNHRIDQLEKKQADMTELTMSIKELVLKFNYTAEKVDGIDSRLAVIEKQPLKSIESAKNTVITTIVSAICGGLVIGVIWLISNHGGI